MVWWGANTFSSKDSQRHSLQRHTLVTFMIEGTPMGKKLRCVLRAHPRHCLLHQTKCKFSAHESKCAQRVRYQKYMQRAGAVGGSFLRPARAPHAFQQRLPRRAGSCTPTLPSSRLRGNPKGASPSCVCTKTLPLLLPSSLPQGRRHRACGRRRCPCCPQTPAPGHRAGGRAHAGRQLVHNAGLF